MSAQRTTVQIQRRKSVYYVVVVSVESGRTLKIWHKTDNEHEAIGFRRALEEDRGLN